MDAIRKKMQSLKSETDNLLATIAKFEGETKEANAKCDQHDCDIRDLGKKIQGYEVEFDETNDKLTKSLETLEEKLKAFKNAEEEVSALARRLMLMEDDYGHSSKQGHDGSNLVECGFRYEDNLPATPYLQKFEPVLSSQAVQTG